MHRFKTSNLVETLANQIVFTINTVYVQFSLQNLNNLMWEQMHKLYIYIYIHSFYI